MLPLDAAPLRAYPRLAPGVRAYAVVRASADHPGRRHRGALADRARAPGRRRSPGCAGAPTSRRSHRAAIARKLSADGEPRLRGVAIPAGATTLSVTARLRGADVLAWLVVADARGRTSLLPLGHVPRKAAKLTTHVHGARPCACSASSSDSRTATRSCSPIAEQRPRLSRRRQARFASGRSRPAAAHPDRLARLDALGRRRRPAAAGRRDDQVTPSPTPGSDLSSGRRSHRRPADAGGRLARHRAGPRAASARRPSSTSRTRRSRLGSSASRTRMPTLPADSGPFVLADEAVALDGDRRKRPRRGNSERDLDLGAGRAGRVAAALAPAPLLRASSSTRGAADEQQLAGDPLAHATVVALGAAASSRSRSPCSASGSASSASSTTRRATSSTSRRRGSRPRTCAGSSACAA